MRIGVLEWASCAGQRKAGLLQDSIGQEGWAMCRSALISLARGGHQAVAVVNAELANDQLLKCFAQDELDLVTSTGSGQKRTWKEVYSTCDATLVIAPEIDGLLMNVLRWCRKHGIRTCNAHSDFLGNACDKLATAAQLRRHGIAHPPTRSLARANERWVRKWNQKLLRVASSSREPIWVMKPRTGAGCDRMLRMTEGKIERHRKRSGRSFNSEDWIVQPWIPGKSYSRAAIFDDAAGAHWLPVTCQRLSITDSVHYRGGVVEPELAARIAGLDDLLMRTVHALGPGRRGWVGIDFLYDADNATDPVTIIEINPRLTTSFVGLCAAGAPDLAASIVAACHGQPLNLPESWQRVQFDAAGEIQVA